MRGLFSIVAAALLAVCMFAGESEAGGFGGRGFGVRSRNFNRGFNQGFRVNNFNRGFSFGVGRVNAFSFNRGFNTFGSRTVQDGFGNVFQVDSFGNAVLVGSAARGFGVNQFGFRSFGGGGFNRGFSFGFGY